MIISYHCLGFILTGPTETIWVCGTYDEDEATDELVGALVVAGAEVELALEVVEL